MTFKYSIIQILFWSVYCCLYAFANSFLNSKGFSAGDVGSILAIGSLISVFMQPFSAKIIENFKSLTTKKITIYSFLAIILPLLIILFSENTLLIYVLFVIVTAAVLNCQTFLYAFIFDYINSGYEVNFGVCRGLGSLSFSIFSILIGYITYYLGFNFIIIYSIIASIIIVFILSNFKYKIKNISSKNIKNKNIGFFEFYKKYKHFTYILLGITFLFFTHNSINTFLFDVLKEINYSNKEVGKSFMMAAAVEIPIMFLFSKLIYKFGQKLLIIICSLGFTLKMIITTIGFYLSSINVIYLGQLSQAFAYAIYVPLFIYYTNNVMDENDKVKGQAYLGTFATAGCILGNYVSGKLIEIYNVNISLIFMILISLIGSLIILLNLKNDKKS